jgi:hypothetical protein
VAEHLNAAIACSPATTIQHSLVRKESLAMSRAYIKGGTPIGSESLCRTCEYAHIMTGYLESEMVTICTRVHPNPVLPFKICECTSYYDKNRPSWKQMQALAIDVAPAPLEPVGFKVGVGFHESTNVRTRVNVDLDVDDEDEDLD